MLKMLGLTYYNIKMLKNDFFSGLPREGDVALNPQPPCESNEKKSAKSRKNLNS